MKNKIYVIGNSCSGKSLFSSQYANKLGIRHLILDSLYYPLRSGFVENVKMFVKDSNSWIIEGVFNQVSDIILNASNYLIYLDVDKSEVLENAKAKYTDASELELRIKMIDSYYQDIRYHSVSGKEIYSKGFHDKIYEEYKKDKIKLKTTRSHEVY